MSEDIAYRQRRYLILMGIRAVCFGVTIVMFVNHLGWITAVPAAGAIVLPYFAVVFANGGREPSGPSSFQAYEPRFPALYVPPAQGAPGQTASSGPAPSGPAGNGRVDPDIPGGNGAPSQNA